MNEHGRVLGDQPRPRLLLAWSDEIEAAALAAEIRPFAPTIRTIASLNEIRHSDYDVLVTDRMPELTRSSSYPLKGLAADPALFVISFAAPEQPGDQAD